MIRIERVRKEGRKAMAAAMVYRPMNFAVISGTRRILFGKRKRIKNPLEGGQGEKLFSQV